MKKIAKKMNYKISITFTCCIKIEFRTIRINNFPVDIQLCYEHCIQRRTNSRTYYYCFKILVMIMLWIFNLFSSKASNWNIE